jgi:hypothetical protein
MEEKEYKQFQIETLLLKAASAIEMVIGAHRHKYETYDIGWIGLGRLERRINYLWVKI